LFSYQLALVIEEKKLDEFINALRFLSSGIRKEKGCLDFGLYRDIEKKDAYRVSGEWQTRQAMEAHFKRKKFSVLIGAARVLGEDFEMSIGETLEKGSYQFAQEMIALQPGKGNRRDTASDLAIGASV
jgi:quinol monooxygenase YgiN